MGPLHDRVTWYRMNYTGTQFTQWDVKNKGTRTSPARLSFVLKFASQCNLFRAMWSDRAKGLLCRESKFITGQVFGLNGFYIRSVSFTDREKSSLSTHLTFSFLLKDISHQKNIFQSYMITNNPNTFQTITVQVLRGNMFISAHLSRCNCRNQVNTYWINHEKHQPNCHGQIGDT